MPKDRFTGPLDAPRSIPDAMKWKNTSGESIPAYGVVKLDSYDDAGDFFNAVKPDGEGDLHFVNGPVAVAVNAYGGSQLWNHSRIGKTSSTTFGEVVGPVDSSWEMQPTGIGWNVFSNPAGGVAALVKAGGGTVNFIHGIVNADLTRGYYTIEIADWSGSTPVTDEVPDICLQATGSLSTSGDDNCTDITLPAFESQLTGTGVYVRAYDPESVLVPLEIGSDCVLGNMGDENALGSASESSAVYEPVYQILRGYQTHVVASDKEYECCETTGLWTLITKRQFIFAAKECGPAQCANC